MGSAQCFDTLELQDQLALDEKVQVVSPDYMAGIVDEDLSLTFCGEILLAELDEKRAPVDLFHEARSERLMYRDNALDHARSERVTTLLGSISVGGRFAVFVHILFSADAAGYVMLHGREMEEIRVIGRCIISLSPLSPHLPFTTAAQTKKRV